MTITKKDLQDALKPLATKVDAIEAQTKDLDKKLQAQSKELKAHTVEQTHELARIINGSFQEQHDFMENQFQGVNDRLDGVETRLSVVDTKLNRALYKENVDFDARITRLEEHAGIKKAAG